MGNGLDGKGTVKRSKSKFGIFLKFLYSAFMSHSFKFLEREKELVERANSRFAIKLVLQL